MIFFLILLTIPAVHSTELLPVIVTPVDMNVTGGSTFSSHKHQVVENDNGVFMAYYWMNDPPPWKGYWNLVQSIDGGETFELVYSSPLQGSCVPCVETDDENSIHLVSSYLTGGNQPFYYHRFLAEKDYRIPSIFEHEGDCASEKFATAIDRDSDRLYLFNNQGTIITFDTSTGMRVSRRIYAYRSGPLAFFQYPHAFVENGTIYHAWTTQRWTGGGSYVYYNIHFIVSPDGGRTWRKANGTALETPFPPDDTGPTDHIVEEIDLYQHTWLNSLIVKDGKAHLCYYTNREGRGYIYVRIDLETGEIDRRSEPRGETIRLNGNGGFFTTSPGHPLYLVSTNGTHVLAVVSDDNGDSWRDLAASTKMPGYVEYMTGSREITSLGIIGSFTLHYDGMHSATFFRIPLDGGPAAPGGARLSLSPRLIEIEQGESKMSRVTVVSGKPDAGEMTLDAQVPFGIELSFDPPMGMPNFSSTLRLKVDDEVLPGLYEIPVTTSGGRDMLNFTFQLEVSQPLPSPDFDMTLEPPTLSIGPGESGHTRVILTPLNGFDDYWSLKVIGAPTEIRASFNPSWGREPYTSDLTITAGDFPMPGRHALNITGSGGGRVHSQTLELIVLLSEFRFIAGATLVVVALGARKSTG